MSNAKEIQKQDRALTKKIPLMELFGPTFQGEGALCGTQTYFLRFGLCDYDCEMCDSRHAIDPRQVKANAEWLTQPQLIEKFAAHTANHCAPWVTFSGGNPCMHNLEMLVASLKLHGFKINVETQGTLCPDWLRLVDLVTISPKSPSMGEKYEPERFQKMLTMCTDWGVDTAVKVVVFAQRDLEFAAQVFDDMEEDDIFPGWINMQPGKYLSLGNPYPPQHENLEDLDMAANCNGLSSDEQQKLALLRDYRILCEDILLDNRFRDVIFLPQLHVLTWANKAEV